MSATPGRSSEGVSEADPADPTARLTSRIATATAPTRSIGTADRVMSSLHRGFATVAERQLDRAERRRYREVAVERVLDAAVARAREFFEGFRSTEDLLPLFNRLQHDKGSSLGYWNYSNLPVAHAFTLRVNGDHAGGRLILDKYVQRLKISGTVLDDLLNRFEKASANSSLL